MISLEDFQARDKSLSETPGTETPVTGNVTLYHGAETPPYETGTPLTDIGDLEILKDVAVIGMACRVAGGNHTPEQLWQAIMEKQDASGEIPAMRWEPYLRRDARNAKTLKETTSRGYFLDNLEGFDAAFFGISPKEAEQMDPQQRLSLEVAWEALESAGIPPQSLSGSDTAVFMGVNSDDYSKLVLEDLPNVEAWMGIGTAYCGVPNRISYHLNLMGPSTAVDAACASSLVAIHHARQAILFGESKVAIAGGVNALCGPGLTAVLDKAGAISSEGCCRSFDNEAKGYGRGEGAAVVILKGLANALVDGDNILALIKGSAVAQDGKTNGIMAPNAKAQELVARIALSASNIEPKTIQYVEAHATSTPLGDPTEVSAISSVYGKDRPVDRPCFIGSVKPNVGHLEAGAGAVGFIKATLAMEKGIIPPQTNLKNPNSKIDWKGAGVKVLTEAGEWPETDGPRRAAICSYGYGGTVSHAVIEQFTGYKQTAIRHSSISSQALLLSSPREKSLALQAEAQAKWISSAGKSHSLDSITTTLATRRGHHEYRAAFVVSSHDEAAKVLSDFAAGSVGDKCTTSRVMSPEVQDVVWVFSGHGAQWKEMGFKLMQNGFFYRQIVKLDEIVQEELNFSVIDALRTGDFEDTDQIQVLTYVVQVGLMKLLRSKGVEPQAIIGHSVGEIAASVAAGCLTPEEGALIVTKRAKLYRTVKGQGGMLLVNLPLSETVLKLSNSDGLVVAIDSSPSSCVVSGPKDAIDALAQSLGAEGIQCFRVKTDIAFHNPTLEKLTQPLSEALSGCLSPKPANVKVYSTSAGSPREVIAHDASYWINNMVKPVYLNSAINAALDDGYRLFIEISTHPIISHSINETIMQKGIEDYSVLPIMRRNKDASETMLKAIGELHCKGVAIDWKKMCSGIWCPEVPFTAWSHKPIWRKIETGPLNTSMMHDVDKHTLLGQKVPVPNDDILIYTTKLDDKTKPFPGSHALHGSEIVPAAGLVNTFLHATSSKSLSNIVLRVPVAISAPRDVQIVRSTNMIKICSRLIPSDAEAAEEMSWITHTTGAWHSGTDKIEPEVANIDVQAAKARISNKLADNFSIDYLDKVGVSAMGFPWAVTEHYGNLNEMIAHVDVAPDVLETQLPWDEHSWAPILDAATSVGSTIFFDAPRLRMPAQIEKVEVFTSQLPPKTGYLYVEKASVPFSSHVSILSEDGAVLAKFTCMRFSEIEGTPGVSGSVESLVHHLAWPPATFSEEPLAISNILAVTSDSAAANMWSDAALKKHLSFTHFSSYAAFSVGSTDALASKKYVVVYIPGPTSSSEDIQAKSELFIEETLNLIKLIVNAGSSARLFVITNVSSAAGPTALAQSPLHGLGRIIASEHPDNWGGLIDTENSTVPLNTMKYVRNQDVVKMVDEIPRVACLRPMPREKILVAQHKKTLLPRPEGTYIITGGLGALGLEIAGFLVEKGARRLVLLSRRGLPPRSEWSDSAPLSASQAAAIERIQGLEQLGTSVHILALDIGAKDGAAVLRAALRRLDLPRILGIVHAAGVLEDQLVLETTADSFHRVLSPKINGALTLHELYPTGSLDFFVLFSSCGQLFGFPGQASYASGNAFLDALATYRRNMGDNAISFQWTSWRALGMASSTDFINAELESKGITDITRDEGFRAWTYAARLDMDHAVVLRSMAFEEGEALPSPLLADIAVRKAPAAGSVFATAGGSAASGAAAAARPSSGAELKAWLDKQIKNCVVRILQLGNASEVDARLPLNDMGVDSVMTVSLRRQLQSTLGVKVPPTITWSYPTVGHLVEWFAEKMAA